MANDFSNALEDILQKAFEGVQPYPGSSGGELSHSEAILLRDELWGLYPEDVRFCIPQILIDLLHFHDKSSDLEDCERLFEFLNVMSEGVDVPFTTAAERHYDQQQNKSLVEAKLEAFGLFNQQQAKAIRDWLEHVQHWTTLNRYCKKDIESAIRYWKRRAEMP